MYSKNTKKQRKMRISSKLQGTSQKPRLSVFRSNEAIYAQLIDDKNGKTLFGITEKQLTDKTGTKIAKAKAVGITLAQKAKEMKITNIIFDKGNYKYHGRVKALAEGAREGGLQF